MSQQIIFEQKNMIVLMKKFLRKQLSVQCAKTAVILAYILAFFICLQTLFIDHVSIKREDMEIFPEDQQRNDNSKAELLSEGQKCIDTPWIDYPARIHPHSPINHPKYSLPKGLKTLQVSIEHSRKYLV